MKKIQKWIALTLLLSLSITSIHGQDEFQYEEDFSPAYMESTQTTHWSAYIPIGVLVAAAIYFGVADQNDTYSSSSNSQDALGSIRDSKRVGSKHSRSSHSNSSLRGSSVRSGYSH